MSSLDERAKKYPELDRRRANLMAQTHGKCRHFNGVMHDACRAGVAYASVQVKNNGHGYLFPCFAEENAPRCGLSDFPSYDEALAEVDKDIAQAERWAKACAAAHNDAKAKGIVKGKGGASQVVCPLCGGTIRYTVATSNGHMWARCETSGCVSWIE